MTHDPLCPTPDVITGRVKCWRCDLIFKVRADCARIAEGAYIKSNGQVDMSDPWNAAVRTTVEYLRGES